MMCGYNWKVKTKSSGYDECFIFDIRSDSVYYNELNTRVRLNKRYQKTTIDKTIPTNTQLFVHHIPLSAHEQKSQKYRERSLYAINEEESSDDSDEDNLNNIDDASISPDSVKNNSEADNIIEI